MGDSPWGPEEFVEWLKSKQTTSFCSGGEEYPEYTIGRLLDDFKSEVLLERSGGKHVK